MLFQCCTRESPTRARQDTFMTCRVSFLMCECGGRSNANATTLWLKFRRESSVSYDVKSTMGHLVQTLQGSRAVKSAGHHHLRLSRIGDTIVVRAIEDVWVRVRRRGFRLQYWRAVHTKPIQASGNSIPGRKTRSLLLSRQQAHPVIGMCDHRTCTMDLIQATRKR